MTTSIAPERPVPPPIPPRSAKTSQRRSFRAVPRVSTKPRSTKPANNRHLPVRRELSAGGVAARKEGSEWLVALLQTEHKRGLVWVLPKGHVEPHLGETVANAARREVQEEAGLRELSIKEQLGVTRFKFQVEDAVVSKTVHYFLMVTHQKDLTPQAEEGLCAAAWFPIKEAIAKLAYDTDQEIVKRAQERLIGHSDKANHRSSSAGRRAPRIHS